MPHLASPMFSRRPTELSHSECQLLSLMQRLQYGQISGLKLQGGQPDPDSVFDLIHKVKFGDTRAVAKVTSVENYALKQKVVELLEAFRHCEEGVIRTLEVQDGLPFRMEVHRQIRLADEANWNFFGPIWQKARTRSGKLGY